MSNERVLNWSCWARDRKITPVSCRSLETNYRSPQLWEYPTLKTELDILDAAEVEKILTAQTFPKAHMAIIVYTFVYPYLNYEGALRKINRFRKGLTHIKAHNFKEYEAQAIQILMNRLG